MGLSIIAYKEVKDWHYSYSTFAKLREMIFKYITGLDLNTMRGYHGMEELPEMTLKFFFEHSDCDGELNEDQLTDFITFDDVNRDDLEIFCNRVYDSDLFECYKELIEVFQSAIDNAGFVQFH